MKGNFRVSAKSSLIIFAIGASIILSTPVFARKAVFEGKTCAKVKGNALYGCKKYCADNFVEKQSSCNQACVAGAEAITDCVNEDTD